MSPGRSARRGLLAGALAIVVAVSLIGCVDDEPMPVPEPSGTGDPSPSASAAPIRDPELLEGGTALANKDYFDFVNSNYLAERKEPSSRGLINNLVKAGFSKKSMEITSDKTPLGRRVDTIEFAVKAFDDCLLGQVGSFGYRSTVVPVTGNGTCLIGKTLKIDW